MIDIHLEIVRFALALHVGIDPEDIVPAQRLEADLGLDALDLVLVVLRLEDIEDAEFPVADLETVASVADLVTLVRSWSSVPPCAPESDTVETLPPPAAHVRRRSGVQPAAARDDVASASPSGQPGGFTSENTASCVGQ